MVNNYHTPTPAAYPGRMEDWSMNYTIASLNDVNFGQVLTLDKNGNKYVVGLYNEETKEYTHKSFDSIGEAYTIFEKLSRCICFGEYSYSDRKAMIK